MIVTVERFFQKHGTYFEPIGYEVREYPTASRAYNATEEPSEMSEVVLYA